MLHDCKRIVIFLFFFVFSFLSDETARINEIVVCHIAITLEDGLIYSNCKKIVIRKSNDIRKIANNLPLNYEHFYWNIQA